MDTSPQALLNLFDSLKTDASGMASLWEECSRMTITRKLQALTAAVNRTADARMTFSPLDAAILNGCAVRAVKTHAAGCVAWITPRNQRWYKFEPQAEFGIDAIRDWLAACTEIHQLYLSASNFDTKVHELYMDRAVIGTTVMSCEQGKRQALNFRVFDPGSFIIQDDDEGYADMFFRERPMSNRAAMAKWGDKAPAQVQANVSQKPQELRYYVQSIYPRSDEDRQRGGSKGMAYEECWIDRQNALKIDESGFNEIPFFANRYLRWSEFSPWGASPTMEALAEIRGVNYLDLLNTTLAEVTVNPRIIMPQGFAGVPDLRAGGITIGGRTQRENPQEWLTGGRFDIGNDIILRKENNIREYYHAPLFEQFREIEKQITAAEVNAREAEKVSNFSPAFTQLTTELIDPMLQRSFLILMRANLLPQPPKEAFYQDAGGTWRIAFPKVVHTSRMAMAIEAMRQNGLANWLGMAMPLAQIGIPVMDILNPDAAFRDIGRGSSLPPSYFNTQEQVEATRDMRAKAAMAAQQQQQLMEMMQSKPIAEAGVKAATGEEAA